MNGTTPSLRIAADWLARLAPWLMHNLLRLFYDIYTNRRLIWQLAVHDLRSRYAATLVGSLWAIIHPVVVILVFWFISTYGLRITFDSGPPYFLFLFCGLVPWMTFNEALTGGAGAVINHAYLVKKIAFPLEILPLVSIVSATLVHFCLIVLLTTILLVSGVHPTLFFLQVFYFLIAMIAMTAGLAWLFAALSVFNRDVGQALNATMTIWFWFTPIVWPIQNLSTSTLLIAQLNPLFYVIEGYRNTFLYGRPALALWPLDLYFWAITIFFVVVGAVAFLRLKPYFADVL